jgi:hypothetical protein
MEFIGSRYEEGETWRMDEILVKIKLFDLSKARALIGLMRQASQFASRSSAFSITTI